MARRVRLRTQDGLAWITLCAHDENGVPLGFTPDLRSVIAEVLDLVEGDRHLRGVIVQGDADGWPVASDPIDDFSTDFDAPDLGALCSRLAGLGRPVLARLSGVISGGALALSQVADLRIAEAGTVFVTHAFALGAFPSAGTLVRLARRVGGARAISFVTGGGPIEATAGISRGLCDLTLTHPDPAQISAALKLLISEGVPRADAALDDPGGYLSALAPLRETFAETPFAEVGHRLLEVVESALLLPLDEALSFEQVAFEELSAEPLSHALRHAAACEVLAQHLPGELRPLDPPAPMRIGLWEQPASLAAAFLEAGHQVALGASDLDSVEPIFASIAEIQEERVRQGALEADRQEIDWARLGVAVGAAGFSGCDALIVPGDANEEWPEAALLAETRANAPAPASVPILIRAGGICEIVPAADQDREALRRLAALLRQGDERVVLGGPGAGGIVEHLRLAYIAAAERSVLAGASVAQVDMALRREGFIKAPLRLADEIGIDRVMEQFARLKRAPGPLLSLLALEGNFGRRHGRGFYHWSGGEARPVLEQGEVLTALRREAGIVPRRLSNSQIRARVMAELANEGAWLLQHSRIHRACDVDFAARHALGLPETLGGLMFAADREGLLTTRKLLRTLREEGAREPATLWDVLIRNGNRFADLG